MVQKAYFFRDSCHTQVKGKETPCMYVCMYVNSVLFFVYSICHRVFGDLPWVCSCISQSWPVIILINVHSKWLAIFLHVPSNSRAHCCQYFCICKDTNVWLCQCAHCCQLYFSRCHLPDTCLHFLIDRQWRTKSKLTLSADLEVCFVSETNEDLFQENSLGIKFLICVLFKLVGQWRYCLN
jgi:hypothetical protein